MGYGATGAKAYKCTCHCNVVLVERWWSMVKHAHVPARRGYEIISLADSVHDARPLSSRI